MIREKFRNYPEREDIDWRFTLSGAPGWGGQFKRMFGMVKQALYKCIGKTNLKPDELEELLLD